MSRLQEHDRLKDCQGVQLSHSAIIDTNNQMSCGTCSGGHGEPIRTSREVLESISKFTLFNPK